MQNVDRHAFDGTAARQLPYAPALRLVDRAQNTQALEPVPTHPLACIAPKEASRLPFGPSRLGAHRPHPQPTPRGLHILWRSLWSALWVRRITSFRRVTTQDAAKSARNHNVSLVPNQEQHTTPESCQINRPTTQQNVPCGVKQYVLPLAAFVLSLVLVIVSWSVDALRYGAVTSHLASVPTQEVMVTQGDSLWTLAQTYHVSGVSTQELVSWLYDHNELTSSALSLGQCLQVPVQR